MEISFEEKMDFLKKKELEKEERHVLVEINKSLKDKLLAENKRANELEKKCERLQKSNDKLFNRTQNQKNELTRLNKIMHMTRNPEEYVLKSDANAVKNLDDQTAIKFLRIANFNWIARDEDGTLYAYTEKPTRIEHCWAYLGFKHYAEIKYDFPFIQWEDNEPYYIGD